MRGADVRERKPALYGDERRTGCAVRSGVDRLRPYDRLRPILDAELSEDMMYMGFDGVRRDKQLLRELLIGRARRKKPEDLALAWGQRIDKPVERRGPFGAAAVQTARRGTRHRVFNGSMAE